MRALSLRSVVFYWLEMKDAERSIEMFSRSAISSHRTELLSGDVLSAQLKIAKEFAIGDNEKLIFLDSNKQVWVRTLNPPALEPCTNKNGICTEFFKKKIVSVTPVYFDDEQKNIWGYLYIEKTPLTNWSLVWGVTAAIIFGMLIQGLGFYFNLMRTIKAVSATLAGWSDKLSTNPKTAKLYEKAPFTEIAPIEAALQNLKSEIEVLENRARQEGAITTLRGVGHDILNPVARMKRILGVLALDKSDKRLLGRDLFDALQSNLRRLSTYAEQIKIIYKRQCGEELHNVPVTNLADEARSLIQELSGDPNVIENLITFESRFSPDSYARIPAGAFGRIVENLCSNSIQASSKESSIGVFVDSNSKYISLIVQDRGHGIPEALQKKIFEPDFTTKPSQGTGLGLYVVKHICEQYNGRISIDSKIDSGTSIKIEFPKAEVANGLQNSAG